MTNASDREKRIKEQTSFLKIKRKGYKGVKNKPALSNKKEVEESIIDNDNGSERDELRYNHNHGKDGRFTTGSGGGSSKKSSGGSKKTSNSANGGKSDNDIDFDKTTPDGETADDGSITMNYLHISNQGTQNYGSKYGQDLEPTGEYMSFIGENQNHIDAPNYTYGKIHFDNPLLIEYKSSGANGWKNDLSNMFGGKTNAELSKAIKNAGYDAVVTYDVYKGLKNWVEIVNLDGKKK